MPLYYLVNTKDGSYWSGKCGWNSACAHASKVKGGKTTYQLGYGPQPRFFSSPAGVWSAYSRQGGLFGNVILEPFKSEYNKAYPDDGTRRVNGRDRFFHRGDAFRAWIKEKGYTSTDLLRLLEQDRGLRTYMVNEGDALANGEPL